MWSVASTLNRTKNYCFRLLSLSIADNNAAQNVETQSNSTSNKEITCNSVFEEDDLRNDQSNSNERKWKKQIQQDISNFQTYGTEYPTSTILQQLAIDQCQDEYLKKRQILTTQLSSGTSVIKQLKTRSKLSDGLPTFFGAKSKKTELGKNQDEEKTEHIPSENDFMPCKEHRCNDSGYSSPNQFEGAKKAANKHDQNENDKSKNEKPENFKDFLKRIETRNGTFFNDYRKDYESKIEFELKNRISICKDEIEPSLNIEVNKSRTAKCIQNSRYLSSDMAYWNAKINQYGMNSIDSKPIIAFKALEEAARMGNSDAAIELEEIRSMFDNGDYSSLVQSFSIAGPEILEERCYIHKYSTRAKEHKAISEPLFQKTDFTRISSDPKF